MDIPEGLLQAFKLSKHFVLLWALSRLFSLYRDLEVSIISMRLGCFEGWFRGVILVIVILKQWLAG